MRGGVSRPLGTHSQGARHLMEAAVRRALEDALGEQVTRASVLGGGDINDAYEAELSSGRSVFVKTNAAVAAAGSMFEAEARGLRWLQEASAIRVPRVLAVSAGAADEAAFLALEYLRPARRRVS